MSEQGSNTLHLVTACHPPCTSQRARQLHPDTAAAGGASLRSTGGIGQPRPWDPAAFIRLSAAYDVLSSRARHQAADRQRQRKDPPQTVQQQYPQGRTPGGSAARDRTVSWERTAGRPRAAPDERGAEWASGPWRQGREERGSGTGGREQRESSTSGREHQESSGGTERPGRRRTGWQKEDEAQAEAEVVGGGMLVPTPELKAWRYGVGDWMLAVRALPDPAADMSKRDR